MARGLRDCDGIDAVELNISCPNIKEGGIAFGLSAALHGALHFREGRVLPGNFDTYPLLRMREMPRVETHIIAQGDSMGGVGEPGTPPIAPAVCNALLALTGKPVRELPIARLS